MSMWCGVWLVVRGIQFTLHFLCWCCYVTLGVGVGVGWWWGNNVHVTLLMYVLLCHTWGGVGVGWGGAITFMLRCYVRAAMQ